MEERTTLHVQRAALFVGIMILAFAAGFIGGISAEQFASPFERSDDREVILEQPQQQHGRNRSLNDLYKKMNQLTVTVVTQEKDDWIISSNRVSYGVILTSDGWIAAVHTAVDKAKTYYAILSDGTVTPILKQVSDPALPITFFRMKANGMQSADFIEEYQQYEAMNAYAFIPNDSIKHISLARKWYPQALQPKDLLRSSDLLQKIYPIHELAGEGIPLYSEYGQFVGLSGSTGVIPAGYIQNGFRKLLQTGGIQRVSLHIPYIDLAHIASHMQTERNGARVTSEKPIILETHSEPALLRDGDIITKVNDQDINENQSLSELLADYSEFDDIALTVHTFQGITRIIDLKRK